MRTMRPFNYFRVSVSIYWDRVVFEYMCTVGEADTRAPQNDSTEILGQSTD